MFEVVEESEFALLAISLDFEEGQDAVQRVQIHAHTVTARGLQFHSCLFVVVESGVFIIAAVQAPGETVAAEGGVWALALPGHHSIANANGDEATPFYLPVAAACQWFLAQHLCPAVKPFTALLGWNLPFTPPDLSVCQEEPLMGSVFI